MVIVYCMVTSEFFQRTGLARGLTTLTGWLADARLPGWLLRPVIRKYIRIHGVNMEEHQIDLRHYRTFNRFFTRSLLPGCQKQGEGITAPADGMVTAAGSFVGQQLFHVKGRHYPLVDLLGKPGFESGSFATIYLSPADYHRVHAPFDCTINAIRHLHGRVQTVNPARIRKDPLLYCRNERVVLEGTSEYGCFFLVLVGAIVVGRIRISMVDDFHKGYHATGLSIVMHKGDETGLFEIGSTVILVMENNILEPAHTFTGRHFRVGECLINPLNQTSIPSNQSV